MTDMGTDMGKPVQYEQSIGDILGHLGATHELMATKGLPHTLSHLIELRVSQINECAFCVKMHSADARKDGETSERLDRLAAWRHAKDFTPAEKAAFAWAEALTYLERHTDYAALRSELRAHYDDQMISLITTCVSMINLWNRVQVSKY
ncbi:MAG: carboxymuconolactone decarboxylase family protein [Ruegeria sp.]|nr:carboxymuconolactone decarboxylase family protein [Ruegeria sp.]